MRNDEDTEQRTLWCGNISDQVTDEILYELFLQAGPLEGIRRPRDPSGRPKSFAFIVYKHECSAPYAVELFRGEKLFNRALNLSSRSGLPHVPVLDTHLSEFTDRSETKHHHRKEGKDHRNDQRRSDKNKDNNEPTSWAELNALKGKGALMNGHSTFKRDDLLGATLRSEQSKSQQMPPFVPDFETLLKLGNQMMPNMINPGILPFGGSPFLAGSPMGSINLMGPMGPMVQTMYPSMQGGMSGGKHFSPEREKRSDHYEGRSSRRNHPYEDRRQGNHSDNRRNSDHYNHRRHDRGYSSSRSSHERERRDRRSR